MEDLVSQGKCLFCGKMFSKRAISRHLATHLAKKEVSPPNGVSFHIKVENDKRYGSGPYFLNLLVDGEATLHDIDLFLRHIWLECCGHMSDFTVKGQQKEFGWSAFYDDDDEELDDEELDDDDLDDDDLDDDDLDDDDLDDEDDDEDDENQVPLREILSKGLEIIYKYDFGSTTELLITVYGEYSFKADEDIVLLSRNEPLEILCEKCHKKPATQICTACIYTNESAFCDSCAKNHAKTCEDFSEYAALPVVNSPRMAICAYSGGTIDIERDGPFVMKPKVKKGE